MYREKFDLGGRVAVVTGGAQGIGNAIAAALAEHGAKVVIADMDVNTGAAAAAALGGEFAALNVRDRAMVRTVAEDISARHGHVDILVNNAGIARNSSSVDTPAEEWLEVIDVNLNGVWWCSQAFGRGMVARGKGAIVNIGSMSGIVANKPQAQTHYNASKAAVHMLTKSLAAEWAPHGVRVNAIAPGYIGTELTKRGLANAEWKKQWLEMTPFGRVGDPSDVAALALFLASDAAAYMSGSVVSVDGGYTSW
jgi:NAD(P)-dependent dehydrogenase (short-subunit alcohol dehydrogenase family)